MDSNCILMCANIPRGIPEDVFVELFCIAGPVEDVSISKSGRSCFIIYEFPEAIQTAKEIFKDVKFFGRSLEMYDQNDIKEIHLQQEQESIDLQQKEVACGEAMKNYNNPFYNPDSMTPTSRNRPQNYPPQNLFSFSDNRTNHFHKDFIPPPNNFHVPQVSYGDIYDPSVPTRRWGSIPEVNQSRSPFSSEIDPFKSPYSQPVSRKSYEQNKKHDYDGAYPINRSGTVSKRYPNAHSSSSDSSTEKFRNDQSKAEVHLFKDTIAEHAYEEQTRRQFFSSPRKSFRENDRYNHSRFDAASTSSDHSNKHKSRDFDRSPYSRNDNKRNEYRDSRRSDNYHDKEYRNRRRY